MSESEGNPEPKKTAYEALHDLLETVGNQVDVLLDLRIIADALEGRHLKLAKGLLIMVVLATFFNVAALLWSQRNIGEVKSTQEDIQDTAKNARQFADRNSKLISELRVVASRAQARGAQTSVELCKELNAIKKPIRTVLEGSERGRQYQNLFKDKDCSGLPNSNPVTP